MSETTKLMEMLRYWANEPCLPGPAATCREAADLIEQQARVIEALKSDIESQIQLTREAMKVAAGYRDALYGIRRYGLDTLWGRTDGPDDRNWQRAAVNEMTKRARQAIDEGRVALAKAVT